MQVAIPLVQQQMPSEDYDGCLDIAESDYNQKQTVVGGQSHNRYAFFSVPVGVNYIELDIKELTVFFDKR